MIPRQFFSCKNGPKTQTNMKLENIFDLWIIYECCVKSGKYLKYKGDFQYTSKSEHNVCFLLYKLCYVNINHFYSLVTTCEHF